MFLLFFSHLVKIRIGTQHNKLKNKNRPFRGGGGLKYAYLVFIGMFERFCIRWRKDADNSLLSSYKHRKNLVLWPKSNWWQNKSVL